MRSSPISARKQDGCGPYHRPAAPGPPVDVLSFAAHHAAGGRGGAALPRKAVGRPLDEAGEATIKRGEEALPAALAIIEDHLAQNKWMMGAEFGLVDCAYCPMLNVIEKSEIGRAHV